MTIDWDMIRAMVGPDAPGWRLIPHDWMWHAFWIGNGYIAAVALGGLALWVEWLFAGDRA
jgi:hypothetical protein